MTIHIETVPFPYDKDVYLNGENPYSEAGYTAFKAWCTKHDVYYYAAIREEFDPFEARRLAYEAGNSKVILEDLS